jgi:hypothetical protein
MYYLFISPDKAAQKDGEEAVLDMNAGLKPTRLTAKLFLNSGDEVEEASDSNKANQAICSGDAIRLL